jgi:hypothetical protein
MKAALSLSADHAFKGELWMKGGKATYGGGYGGGFFGMRGGGGFSKAKKLKGKADVHFATVEVCCLHPMLPHARHCQLTDSLRTGGLRVPGEILVDSRRQIVTQVHNDKPQRAQRLRRRLRRRLLSRFGSQQRL